MLRVPLGPIAGFRSVVRMRRVAVAIGAAVYLATLAGFLFLNLIGDPVLFPLSYFFTWDMFPAHNTQSVRRVAVGRTRSGKLLQLHPSPHDQFRGGTAGDLTRIELESRGLFYRAAVEHTLRLCNVGRPADPVTHVYLFEKYWPVKYNYPADIYEAWAYAPKPDRVTWRLFDEFDVAEPVSTADTPRGEGS